MSIRRKPEDAVPLLLARLREAKEHVQQGATTEDENDAKEIQSLSSKFNDIEKELQSMIHLFPKVKSWEEMIIKQFCVLEKELDDDIFKDPKMKSEVNDKLELMKKGIRELRELIPRVDKGISKLRAMSFKPRDLATDDIDLHQTVCQEWVDLEIQNKILERSVMSGFFKSFYCLSGSQPAKMCSLCLSVFPMNSVIEKKPLIYWWMGEGLVMKSPVKTAEEVGEQVFGELLNNGFIRPSSKNKSRSVSSFIIDPWIHRTLILIAKENLFQDFSSHWTPSNGGSNGKRREFLFKVDDESYIRRNGESEEDLLMVFNVNEQYLRKKSEWLFKLKRVEVLQMGRWQNSVTHHIEVEDKELFNGLGSQKHLKYLSLRGISRIETLPDSISKLISLQILDLRACHNLERLPPTITRLKNLTHLDISDCYLLESMPKGLENLLALQVFKGFVVGKAEKNTCKISDLADLKKLRKLSIRVGNQGETKFVDHFKNLKEKFSALAILTISWGNYVSLAQGKSFTLPRTLKKLDLRCVPFEEVPEWLWPTKLPQDLAKLYIKGGKLKSLEHTDTHKCWKVECLRLKHLKDMKINEEELVSLFPDYLYLDKINCYGQPHSDITLSRSAQVLKDNKST